MKRSDFIHTAVACGRTIGQALTLAESVNKYVAFDDDDDDPRPFFRFVEVDGTECFVVLDKGLTLLHDAKELIEELASLTFRAEVRNRCDEWLRQAKKAFPS